MRALRMLMIMVLGLTGMSVASAPAEAVGGPEPDEVKSVTWPLRVERRTNEVPINGGTAYYCAVGVFVSFNDLPGYEPTSMTVTYFDAPSSYFIGDAPYDDNLVFNGMSFKPEGGTHHRLYKDLTYSQGGSPGDRCQEAENKTNEWFGDTATINYEHTDRCKKAITKLLAAKDKVKAAKNKLDKARGPKAIAAARQALNAAKAKLKKAKKKYKSSCK